MNKLLYFALIASTLTATSCNNTNGSNDNASENATDTLPAVETNKANSDYKPAFEGQTRIHGVKTATEYQHKVVTNKLTSPWGISVLPDGRLLITENAGVLRIVSLDGTVSEAITGLPKVDDNAQGGLLGITIDPEFENNRMVYWAFS